MSILPSMQWVVLGVCTLVSAVDCFRIAKMFSKHSLTQMSGTPGIKRTVELSCQYLEYKFALGRIVLEKNQAAQTIDFVAILLCDEDSTLRELQVQSLEDHQMPRFNSHELDIFTIA